MLPVCTSVSPSPAGRGRITSGNHRHTRGHPLILPLFDQSPISRILVEFRRSPQMFAKLLPREEQYFSLFAQMTSYINDAATTLVEMLSHHDGDYQEYVQRINGIAHGCDDLTQNVATRLNQSFITPFDREDIYMMSKALDDVVDLIDGAARAVVMYDIHESTAPAKQLAGVIQRMALQLHEVVKILQKPKGVTERLVELHRLEHDGDDIYQRAAGA